MTRFAGIAWCGRRDSFGPATGSCSGYVPRPASALAGAASTLVAGLFLLVGCAGDSGGAAGVTVRDSAGIVIVDNDWVHRGWRAGDEWRLSDAPRIRIGTVSGDSTQQLYRVVDARRLSDSRIAVVNSGTAEIRIYDEQGGIESVIGRRGDGPGEFRGPWAVHQLEGDSILVVDLYREISVFDRDGVFVRRFTPERPDGAMGGEGFEPVGAFGDGSLLFRSHHRFDESRKGPGRSRISMIRTRLDGTMAGSLGDFDDQTVQFGGPGPYIFGAWAREAAADHTMWYGPGDRFELQEIGFDGRLLRLVRLAKPARPVTQSDIDAFTRSTLERARGTPQEQFLNRYFAAAQFPPEFPAHFELAMDGAGNLWVQDYQPFNDRVERLWAVFDGGGRFLGEVRVPAGVTVFEIGEDYLLGAWTDELDVEYVVMYDLIKPV